MNLSPKVGYLFWKKILIFQLQSINLSFKISQKMKNVCESFRKKCHLSHYTIVKFKPNLNESLVWVWILSQLFYVELYASLASFCSRVCYALLKSWGKRKALVTSHHKRLTQCQKKWEINKNSVNFGSI